MAIKVVAVLFPENDDFNHILSMVMGTPILVAKHPDNRKICFYVNNKDAAQEDIKEDVRFNLSSCMSSVLRKTRGHKKFVEVCQFLGNEVNILIDDHFTLYKQYGNIGNAMKHGLLDAYR